MTRNKIEKPDRQLPDYQTANQQTVGLIFAISRDEYGEIPPRLVTLFSDVGDLYAGHWSSHEACAVSYHNFNHALDVSLAAARMLSGWNKVEQALALDEKYFQLGMAAALFHDSGYIKSKGDLAGAGGKFTLVHVERSMEIAREYLTGKQWQPEEVEAVSRMISITDYAKLPDLAPLFKDPRLKVMAQMVATADLVAQMADTDYVQRIDDLFAEFKEVYEFESSETLNQTGTKVYKTVQEIKDGTIAFYEHFVVPTLAKLGRVDRYLTFFFGDGRNPYQENITANLSSHLMDVTSQWRRIGDILTDLGLASSEQIAGALARQRKLANKNNEIPTKDSITLAREHLLPWFTARPQEGLCLGDILMEMQAVEPKSLAKGLLAQMLPDSLYGSLSPRELHFLLQSAILLQNICKGPWILGVVLEMANEILDCEASSILIADLEEKTMIVALPTGPKKNLVSGKSIAMDKGLSGWVYRNGQSARVSNVSADVRFDNGIDKNIDFATRSILAVPLYVNGECIGVVEALNKSDDNFSQHDMNVLTILANMLANVMVGVLYIQSEH
ncbi:MAG: GAF domain-containing protein [Desulfobulbaceae bacterium]|nr:GAF domain-containing protein [Desulfobulbaceae bacterium]HIJ89906.1 GAF domain-containing protein [Deltaproteobacteria bacterium]